MKIKDMIGHILHFSRGSSVKKQLLDVSEVFDDAWKLTRMIVPSSFKVEVDIQESCGAVLANSVQLSQILLNLVSNAVDAHDGSTGEIEVDLSRARGKSDKQPLYYRLSDREYAILRVTDAGTGIAPDVLRQIFDPFFTTKDVGQGTGLGLSEVAGIMRDVGGAIDIESTLGKGTSFLLYFPLEDNPEQTDDLATDVAP